MGEVVILNCPTRLDIPVERVIQSAVEAQMSEIIIIGFDADGEFFFSSNKANGGDVIWHLEMAKKKLLEVDV